VLGDLIAGIALGEGDVSPALVRRFRWRPELDSARGEEAARFGG
jgi:hypothetical protein